MNIKGIIRKKRNIDYATPGSQWNAYSGCLATTKAFDGYDCAVKERNACWAKKMANRLKGKYGYNKENPFQPTFHPDKLEIPLHWKKPRRIPCCFMGDISFAKKEWILKILEIIEQTPQHIYYILTKRPRYLVKYDFPDNALVGVTVNISQDFCRVTDLLFIKSKLKYISFEPIYEELGLIEETRIFDNIDWIILGAQTNPIFQPKKEWVKYIVKMADKFKVPVFMKDNLAYEPKRYEFPFEVKG